MTTSITALERKALQLLNQVDGRRRPKTHTFVLEGNDQLTKEQRATIGPYDQVVIRRIPQGWLQL